MKYLTLLFAALAAAAALDADKKSDPTVYLIRHGEKPDDDDMIGLNSRGEDRAECLRKVFGNESDYNIDCIMTQQFKDTGKRIRPFLTCSALAADLGIQIDFSCDRDDPKCVKDAIQDHDGDGNCLICWEHDALKDIAQELGADNVEDYPKDSFDLIWEMDAPYDKINSITSEHCPGLDA